MKHALKSHIILSRLKPALVSAAVTLILCGTISGTVAWLTAETDPVVNTFTYGDINIKLEETDTNKDGDNDPNTNTYPMIPGNRIEKDPIVTVLADSENAWLFVKLERSANFDEFMTFAVSDGWTALEGEPDVYYREVDKSETDTAFMVLRDNTVNVKSDVTKEMLNALGDGTYPTLTVTAYAVQRDNNVVTAADAWGFIQP